MDPVALRWLRLIACGLPLTTVAATASLNFACECPESVTKRHLTEEERTSLLSTGELDEGRCLAMCEETDPLYAVSDSGTIAYHYSVSDCRLDEEPIPRLICTWSRYCPGGRRPSLGEDTRAYAQSDVGVVLADLARRETLSVTAFEELAYVLARDGAPETLVREARESAEDERRHARVMRDLARRYGVDVSLDEGVAERDATLGALLETNAVEGCVREAYGALVAAYQAEHAADEDVRDAFAEIAKDEARHALFSFSLHAYARASLDVATFARLDARRREEAGALLLAVGEPAPEPARAVLGLPDVASARTLAAVVGAAPA